VHMDRLNELARAQRGVFARWQALELGFTHYVIAHRVETKQWRRVMGAVFAAATAGLDDQSLEWAAYLACGRGSILSGPSALRRHGLDVGVESPHWVTVPPERHVTLRGVRMIREAVDPDDVVMVDGMRVTSVSRSMIDTLRVLPEYAGQPLLDRGLLRGWLSVEELEIRAHQLAGRRGVGRLRSHLTRVRGGARSEAERRLHALLERAGFTGWVANCKIFDVDGALMAVIDVAFEEAKLALEVDGLAFHTDPDRFQRDRRRQNWLVNQGWTVLRFTWDDLTQRRRQVIDTIRDALARREDPT
jgi:very-short-patch-repair endonuclease